MSDSIQPAVLERPRMPTELSQLSFEVIAGDYSRPGNRPANYTLVKGRREALLVDVPFGRADAHRLIARILDTGLKLHTIFITQDHLDHFFSLDLLTETFPKASVVAHSVVAADIKRSISLKVDRLAESERTGANSPWRRVVPTPLGFDHIRLEGHELQILGPMQGNHVHATALWDPRTGTLIAGDLLYNGVFAFLGEHRPAQCDAWLESLDYLEALRPKRVVAGHSKPGLPDDDKAIDWTRGYIRDLMKFARSTGLATEMADTPRASYPNAIGSPGSQFLLEVPTQIAIGEIETRDA
jgi:glyoxylase-like metal-dependent hydrolase (beta-lactamase superfamily II)